jgi:hypothetical protein
LAPYFAPPVKRAFLVPVALTIVALFVIGSAAGGHLLGVPLPHVL